MTDRERAAAALAAWGGDGLALIAHLHARLEAALQRERTADASTTLEHQGSKP